MYDHLIRDHASLIARRNARPGQPMPMNNVKGWIRIMFATPKVNASMLHVQSNDHNNS